MNVLIDTTIWSLALRRRRRQLNDQQHRLVTEWRRLIEDGAAVLAGPIRQEILSGIRSFEQFERIRNHLDGFDCPDIWIDDYDQAARFYNHLRHQGLTAGSIDLLLCAIAYRHNLAIFTTDNDFERYADHLPVQLHRVETQ